MYPRHEPKAVNTVSELYEQVTAVINALPGECMLDMIYLLNALRNWKSEFNGKDLTQRNLQPLRQLLVDRAQQIMPDPQNVYAEAYPYTPNNAVSRAYLTLAQYLEPYSDLNRFQLLMPSIVHTHNYVTDQDLRDPETQLRHFVLTDDLKGVIDVYLSIVSSKIDGKLRHTHVLKNGQLEVLSPTEAERVRTHSKEAKNLSDAIQSKVKAETQGDSFGAVLHRLAQMLRVSSVGEGVKRRTRDEANTRPAQPLHATSAELAYRFEYGTSDVASIEAVEGIGHFLAWQDTLSQQDINRLEAIQGDSVRSILIQAKQCTGVAADRLDKLLKLNPDLYDAHPEVTQETQKASYAQASYSVQEAQREFLHAILYDSYKVTGRHHNIFIKRKMLEAEVRRVGFREFKRLNPNMNETELGGFLSVAFELSSARQFHHKSGYLEALVAEFGVSASAASASYPYAQFVREYFQRLFISFTDSNFHFATQILDDDVKPVLLEMLNETPAEREDSNATLLRLHCMEPKQATTWLENNEQRARKAMFSESHFYSNLPKDMSPPRWILGGFLASIKTFHQFYASLLPYNHAAFNEALLTAFYNKLVEWLHKRPEEFKSLLKHFPAGSEASRILSRAFHAAVRTLPQLGTFYRAIGSYDDQDTLEKVIEFTLRLDFAEFPELCDRETFCGVTNIRKWLFAVRAQHRYTGERLSLESSIDKIYSGFLRENFSRRLAEPMTATSYESIVTMLNGYGKAIFLELEANHPRRLLDGYMVLLAICCRARGDRAKYITDISNNHAEVIKDKHFIEYTKLREGVMEFDQAHAERYIRQINTPNLFITAMNTAPTYQEAVFEACIPKVMQWIQQDGVLVSILRGVPGKNGYRSRLVERLAENDAAFAPMMIAIKSPFEDIIFQAILNKLLRWVREPRKWNGESRLRHVLETVSTHNGENLLMQNMHAKQPIECDTWTLILSVQYNMSPFLLPVVIYHIAASIDTEMDFRKLLHSCAHEYHKYIPDFLREKFPSVVVPEQVQPPIVKANRAVAATASGNRSTMFSQRDPSIAERIAPSGISTFQSPLASSITKGQGR